MFNIYLRKEIEALIPQAIEMDLRRLININSINIFKHTPDTLIVMVIINGANSQIDKIMSFLNIFYNEYKQNGKDISTIHGSTFQEEIKSRTTTKKGTTEHHIMGSVKTETGRERKKVQNG